MRLIRLVLGDVIGKRETLDTDQSVTIDTSQLITVETSQSVKYYLGFRKNCKYIHVLTSHLYIFPYLISIYSRIHIKLINQDYLISRISQSILNQFSWNCIHTIFHLCRDYPGNFAKFW